MCGDVSMKKKLVYLLIHSILHNESWLTYKPSKPCVVFLDKGNHDVQSSTPGNFPRPED